MNVDSDALRRCALRLFWMGAAGFAAFALLVSGAELWKRVIAIALWVVGAIGAAAYAYLFVRDHLRK